MTAAQVKVVAILVALAALAAIAAPGASAGTYEVQVCSQFAPGDGLTFSEAPNSLGFESEFTCGNPGRFGGRLNIHADSQTNMRGGALWTLKAPNETAIRSLEATRLAIPAWTPRTLVWEVKNGRGAQLDSVASPGPEVGVKYSVTSTSLTIGMRCTRNTCSTGDSGPGVSLNGIVAAMEENRAPEVSVLATQELAGPVRGTVAIPFKATDKGAGVQLSALFVDDQLTASAEDTNDGKCVVPFRFLAPCDLELEASFALDTTKLKNGPHLVHVEVGDASGIPATSKNVLVTVDNTPPPVDPPKPPTAPAVPTPPTLTPPMKLPPALSAVSLSRKSIAAGKGKAELRFASTEAGTLTVVISPAQPQSAKPLATLTRAVGAGPSSLALAAKAKGKPLRPGAYRLTATLRSADGRASAPATLRFKILPR
ncbi:MAG TPA: hypothetical protein VF081_12560 [Solirubrobacterales bacterium]